MMEFRFNIRKATEAACRFVEASGKSVSLVRLMKLLYLADRESLRLRGHAIIGDRYVSMEHGPVVSRVYDLCKEKPQGEPEHMVIWLRHLRSTGREVELVEPAPIAALSRRDVEIIDNVFKEWRNWDTWDLVKHLHETLAEWKNPGKSSRPIRLQTLCDALKLSDEQRRSVEDQARLSASACVRTAAGRPVAPPLAGHPA